MTPAEIVTVASDTAAALSAADSGWRFVNSITKLIHALSCVPDYSSPVFSSEQIAKLESAGVQAIAAIEDRIETGDDAERIQLQMANAVYKLRRELEYVDSWRRHYLS
jgi:hypothetical protein